MRDSFVQELLHHAQHDDEIMLVVGDLGYGVVEAFASMLPNQYVNAGVSEQAMMSMAAGLATAGHKVFVYSIANFPTLRCLEQIRNDVAYNRLDVTIVSVGAGLSYGTLGYTHHAIEDITIMRALPDVSIVSPADPVEAVAAVSYCLERRGTNYVRLGKSGEPSLYSHDRNIDISEGQLLTSGTDFALVGTGAIVGECLQAAGDLAREGIHVQVWSIPLIKPMPLNWLSKIDPATPILTVEEHVGEGGFGSAVLEAVNDAGVLRPVHRLALQHKDPTRFGSHAYLRETMGVSQSEIRAAVLNRLPHERRTQI